MNKSNVPATSQPRQQTPQKSTIAPMATEDVSAMLMRRRWGSVMEHREFAAVAKIIHLSFPKWGPWQAANNFTLLGGSTIYLNADGYYDLMAEHPETQEPPIFQEIKPETPEWEEFLGEETPAKAIAAAFICEVKRRDRNIPFRDGNYCPMDDPLLFHPKTKKRYEHWKALANKIAKTRAARRTMRMAYSTAAAAAAVVERKVEEIVERAARRELPKPVLPSESPYEETESIVVQSVPEDVDVDTLPIREADRRRLFAIVERLDTGDYTPHVALKMAVAEVMFDRGMDVGDIDDVSTKAITYGMYVDVVERMHEMYPLKDRDVVEVESEEVPDDGVDEVPENDLDEEQTDLL